METELKERPAIYESMSPFLQLVVFIGLEGLSWFELLLVIMALQLAGVVNMSSLSETANFNDPNVVSDLKIIQILSPFIVFVLPVLVFILLVSRHGFSYLGLNKSGKISIIILGGLLMLFASPLINWLAEVNGNLQLPHKLREWEDQADHLTNAFVEHQTTKGLIINTIMIAILPGVCEELFFRGVIQKLLLKIFKNPHTGIWVTGAIFSAFHMEFYGFVPRMLMGVYLGYLFYWTGSLWPGIFAHFLNNFSSIVIAYLEERSMVPQSTDTIGANSSEYIYVLFSAAIIILLLIPIYKMSKRNTALQLNS